MSTRTEVMMWAQRVIARKNGPPHLLLEIREGATPSEAQDAFHKIARAAHPDLHRHGLSAEDLEMVTSAYAAVASAYMQVRSQAMTTQRMKPLKPEEVGGLGNAAPVGSAPHRPTPIPAGTGRTPPAGVPAAPATGESLTSVSPQAAAAAMSPKAIVYFRKAEGALKRGDFKSAVLQVKLAIAADPSSTFLRNALAEIDAELRKGT